MSMNGSPLQSSGETAIATTSDTSVTVLAALTAGQRHSVTIINEGSVAGFFSLDGGTTWCRLPATFIQSLNNITSRDSILVKRSAGGSNLSGIYAYASL